MAKRFPRFLPAVLLLVLSGCSAGRHSAAGFRLPEGSPERGKATLIAFGCHNCHELTDQSVPRPTVQPPVPVVLGGPVDQEFTDGYLVTSIIHPSYTLGHYPSAQVAVGGQSRMPHYADRMTVQQLSDIVAYLQSQYTIRPAPPPFPYH